MLEANTFLYFYHCHRHSVIRIAHTVIHLFSFLVIAHNPLVLSWPCDTIHMFCLLAHTKLHTWQTPLLEFCMALQLPLQTATCTFIEICCNRTGLPFAN